MRNFFKKLSAGFMLLALAVLALPQRVMATPQVEAQLISADARTLNVRFTPNSEVKSYWAVLFEKGEFEATYEMYKPMFGFNSYAEMLMTWGSEKSTAATISWKSQMPNTVYEIYVQCEGKDGSYPDPQVFEYSTAKKGGDGASVLTLEVKEFFQENGEYKQRLVWTANDQTSFFYSQPWPEEWDDEDGKHHKYDPAEAKQYLLDIDASESRDTYACFDTDDWNWFVDRAQKYHATAIGKNANGEWGEMADVVFTTPGYVDPNAQSIWWGYGDGKSFVETVGRNGKNVAAVKLSDEVLNAYNGATMTDIRFAVNGACTDVSYFVLVGEEGDADAKYTLLKTCESNAVAVGNLSNGWHEFHLANPVTISANTPIYVGYIATGNQPIALAGTAEEGELGGPGSCIFGSSTKNLEDYGTLEGMNYSLALQVKLESNNFTASATLSDFGTILGEIGKTVEVKGTIRSLSPVPITSYKLKLTVDGEGKSQKTFNCDIQEKDGTSDFALSVNGLDLGDHAYKLSLLALNGENLEKPIVREGTITIKEIYLTRRNVFEDMTGTWCGYCPRAAEGLEQMKKAYPNDVIVIAVHKQDKHETSDYANLTTSGYPTVYINRGDKCGGGDYASLYDYFNRENAKEIKGESRIVAAEYADASQNKVKILVRSRFAKDESAHTYRLGFVMTEDDIYDYQQTNLGYGGGYIYLQDVARMYDKYAGIEGSIPTEVVAGESYFYTYTLTYPTKVNNRSKAHLIVLLQQGGGKTIVNGDQVDEIAPAGTYNFDELATGIDTVLRPGQAIDKVYDLSGRRVIAPQPGRMTIQNGRKMIAE